MTELFSYQMAKNGKRSGKYRHVFGEPNKEGGQYLEVRNPQSSGESTYLKANHKFWCVAKAAGGGPLYIQKLGKYGRIPADTPMLSVHKGKTLDMDFHPFISNMIATASDDCSAMVSEFPIDGLTENVQEPRVTLKGHGKKVVLCQFNPCANSILATGSYDKSVKVWDIEKQTNISSYEDIKDNIYSMEWQGDGSRLAIASKDKNIHLVDPRTESKEANKLESFGGSKSSKCFWMNHLGWVGSFGFSKTANRMLKFWDLKDLSKPIYTLKIDSAASVLCPYYDDDTGLLFYYGKGDGTVAWCEIVNDAKKCYPLGSYRSTEPQKGGNFIAKKGVNVWKCEIARFLKLTKNSVIPIPICAPRKAGQDVFQQDLYPDCLAGKPALSADEWAKGENKDPIRMPMDPAKRDGEDDSKMVFVAKKTYEELETENQELKDKIKILETKLATYEQGSSQHNNDNNQEQNNEEQNEDDDGGNE